MQKRCIFVFVLCIDSCTAAQHTYCVYKQKHIDDFNACVCRFMYVFIELAGHRKHMMMRHALKMLPQRYSCNQICYP